MPQYTELYTGWTNTLASKLNLTMELAGIEVQYCLGIFMNTRYQGDKYVPNHCVHSAIKLEKIYVQCSCSFFLSSQISCSLSWSCTFERLQAYISTIENEMFSFKKLTNTNYTNLRLSPIEAMFSKKRLIQRIDTWYVYMLITSPIDISMMEPSSQSSRRHFI